MARRIIIVRLPHIINRLPSNLRFVSAAGAETTATTLYWWALAMVAYPEVQKRAQAELDSAVGRSRVPTFSDAANLPYIQAIVKEVLRWRPALPLGLPHTSSEDDWYNGMFIPKGTLVLPNLWSCNHESSSYGDDAKSFRPERFLDANSKAIPGPAETREEGHGTFGFGRRACVGKHLANEALFIDIATVLWAANFERALDQDGKEVLIDTESFVDTGMVLYAYRHDNLTQASVLTRTLQPASPIRMQDYPSIS